jgi:hypothetical protein
MAEDTFQDFLERAEAANVIDFRMRIVRSPKGHLDFYIHPDGKNGDTGDFHVSGSFVTPMRDNLATGSDRPNSPPLIGS